MEVVYDPNIFYTAVASITVQVVIGGVTLSSFFVNTTNERLHDDLRAILMLELTSQVVEFLWYIVVVCRYGTVPTWTRYLDWVVSTPVMLASTILFLLHRRSSLGVDVLGDVHLWIVLVLNWLMLLAGFLGETDVVSMPLALACGGVAFVASFVVLGTFVDATDTISVVVYGVMYVVWALYGVAAAFGYVVKNIAYNLLDVVSKNCYGLFLFFYILVD